MDFLKEWVRGLVSLVLLASCLELLLPMNRMQKYVRLTMGLVVMLAVTRPILTFLGQPVSMEAAQAAFALEGTEGHLPSMGEIMAMGARFREKNQSLALEEAAQRMASVVEQAARGVKGVSDAEAYVLLDQTGEEPQIRQVSVTVVPGQSGGLVRPVDPVVIKESPQPPAPDRDLESDWSETERALAETVRQEVASRLGIKPNAQIIQVRLRRGTQEQRR